MAKKSRAFAAVPSSKTTAEIHDLMLELASGILSDFFFDPEREDQYRAVATELKQSGLPETELSVLDQEIEAGSCTLRLLALRTRLTFRIIVTGPSFEVAFEGLWNLEEEGFTRSALTAISGPPRIIVKYLDDLAESLSEDLLQGEEFADLMAEIARQVDDEAEDENDAPPEATSADRRRVKQMAAAIARRSDPRLPEKDSDWLEETPQSLPIIVENFIAEASRPGIDPQDPGIVAYLVLLSEQLQFLRYRLDEGRSWPNSLLLDMQASMLDAAEQDEISPEAWMMLATVLTESRVPVSEEMQQRLAEAGLSRDVDGLPHDLGDALGEMLDMIAGLNTTPFEILDGMLRTGAVIPAEMRCFIATELALSGHASLRETVPLMLLEEDASVRRQAAQALTQTAKPDSVSGTSLRRMIAVRNWLPPDDRPQVDAAIRAVRLSGVEPTAWPSIPADLEAFASFIDGSAAQSIVFVNRTGRTHTVGGLLLRHGNGIRDAWIHQDLSREDFAELMKTVTGKMGAIKVDRRYADQVIQHAIAAGLAAGHVPPPGALALAEAMGAHDWHDRHLDIAAEANAEWQHLPEDVRRSDTSAALHRRAGDWLEQTPFFRSWYEGGPSIEKRYRKMAPALAAKRLLHEELETHRLAWAEKFLLVALCCKASQDPAYRTHVEELLVVARALTNGEPLASIPAMQLIAETSVAAAGYRGW